MSALVQFTNSNQYTRDITESATIDQSDLFLTLPCLYFANKSKDDKISPEETIKLFKLFDINDKVYKQNHNIRITESMINNLDTHEINRIEEFSTYSDGWDFGKGKKLSTNSLHSLDIFLNKFSSFPPEEPSVFMNTDGNIELEWENEKGSSFIIEFLPDGFSYYFDSIDEEAEIKINNIDLLIEKLSKAQKI